jgi:hypothetical protein
MTKKLTLTHDDDAFFEKGVAALAARAGISDDAEPEEKLEAAKGEMRNFLREAVKQDELRRFDLQKRAEKKQLSTQLDATLDAQTDNLTITVE